MSGREEGGIVTKGSEYNRIRDEITAKLKLLRDPATGEKVIDSIIMKEDAYSGSYLDLSPDIIVQFKDYAYSIGESIVRQEIIIDRRNVPLGNHHIDGILFAHGTDIASGRNVEHAEIVDIAPTILYALGLPAPDYFDGKVLTDLFEDNFVKRNPVQVQMEAEDIDRTKESVYTQEEAAEMEEQLRGMGYI
jgi:predicted AlkP superfamily phosphohydrolase/phosphomutase